MNWLLTSSVICFIFAAMSFCLTPRAKKGGLGQIVGLLSVVLLLFSIGYFVAWILRMK